MTADRPTPRGWYFAADVAMLVGVTPRTIGQWATHDYIRATRDQGPPQVFSFQDVAEAMMVRDLVAIRGVPARQVRATVINTREKYGDWPLNTAPLGLAKHGPRLGLRTEDGAVEDVGRGAGNERFLPGMDELSELIQYLRRGGWVIRDHPEIEHIEVNPEKMSGTPTIKGRRVSVVQVAKIAQEEGGRKELREEYDLTKAEIDDATKWWKAVAELQAAA